MGQDNFGAGIFDDAKSHTPPPSPSPHQEPLASATSAAPAESIDAVSESEPIETPAPNDFQLQQERDREKAMLLRRSRSEGGPEIQEPERRPAGGERWERGPQQQQQGERPFRSGNRPPFGQRNNSFDGPRRGGHGQERMQERGNERAATFETPAPDRDMRPSSPVAETRGQGDFRDRRAMPDRRHSSETIPSAAGAVLLDQRVAVLVDVQNMYHSARKLHGRNLSYAKLVQNTVKGRKLVRAIAYLLDRDGVDQNGFLEHLSHSGFEVRRKELIERADGSRKGDWDLGIAIDAITLAEKVDVVMLVSGDGDFSCLAQLLRHRGIKVEIASFRESTADALIQASDAFHPLGKDSLY